MNSKYMTLVNGVKIPLMGLGTYPMKGAQLESVLKICNENGYELYDSAWYYKNEEVLGNTLRKLEVPREKLFITSKLKAEQYLGRRRHFHLDKKSVKRCYEDTLRRYKVDYLDLYLMHSYIDEYMEAYGDIIKLYEKGMIRSIGVCNCTIDQLERFKNMFGVYPMVNQIEMHPYYNRKELVNFCKKNNIQVQAFSPFAHGDYFKELLQNESLIALAKKHNKTIGQIILRWFVQNNISVIPQSANPNHLKENISIFDFELSLVDVETVEKLNRDQSWGSFSKRKKRTFLGFNLDKH